MKNTLTHQLTEERKAHAQTKEANVSLSEETATQLTEIKRLRQELGKRDAETLTLRENLRESTTSLETVRRHYETCVREKRESEKKAEGHLAGVLQGVELVVKNLGKNHS